VFPHMVVLTAVPRNSPDPRPLFGRHLPSGALSWSATAEAPGRRMTLVGELDVATAPLLAEALRSEIDRARGTVVLDMDQVTFMDLSGLEVIVAAAEALAVKGQALSLVRPSRCVRRLLAVISMSQYFGLANGDEERRSDGAGPR
jgi:stage II sporulation protein AA (anti-sigma F factor antagonist)